MMSVKLIVLEAGLTNVPGMQLRKYKSSWRHKHKDSEHESKSEKDIIIIQID